MSANSEIKLIEQYLAGDKESLEILIKQYLKPIYRFIYHYLGSTSDAEDITQEVFVKMWRHLKKYNPEKSFKTWLFSIARNAAIDYLRKKKAIPFSAFDSEDGSNIIIDTLADPEQFLDELINTSDSAEIIKSALARLSPPNRLVLTFYYSDGFNFREISEITGEPLDTIKSRQRRALLALKKIITDPSNPCELNN